MVLKLINDERKNLKINSAKACTPPYDHCTKLDWSACGSIDLCTYDYKGCGYDDYCENIDKGGWCWLNDVCDGNNDYS